MCSVHTPHTSHTIFHSFPTHPSSDLATLGQIGFEQRLEYAAIGSVTNLASRLCDEAKANQIVVSRRVYGMVEPWVEGRPIDDLNLKGFNHPILAAEIMRWREEVDNVVDAAAARRKKMQ